MYKGNLGSDGSLKVGVFKSTFAVARHRVVLVTVAAHCIVVYWHTDGTELFLVGTVINSGAGRA